MAGSTALKYGQVPLFDEVRPQQPEAESDVEAGVEANLSGTRESQVHGSLVLDFDSPLLGCNTRDAETEGSSHSLVRTTDRRTPKGARHARRGIRRDAGSRTQEGPVTEDEAAAFGRALLAEMRGEELRPDQALLLANARQRAEGERRAPKPIVDLEHTLLVLDRGSRAEVRIAVRRYRGSRPFLDIRRWEQTPEGLRPTRQGVSIRAREVTGLLATLGRATRWLASAAG